MNRRENILFYRSLNSLISPMFRGIILSALAGVLIVVIAVNLVPKRSMTKMDVYEYSKR